MTHTAPDIHEALRMLTGDTAEQKQAKASFDVTAGLEKWVVISRYTSRDAEGDLFAVQLVDGI